MDELITLLKSIKINDVNKIIISNKRKKSNELQKVIIRGIELRGELVYQVEKFTEKQAFHLNIKASALEETILGFLEDFKQIDLLLVNETIVVKANKVNKIHLSRKAVNNGVAAMKSHNRKKTYLLEEGMNIPAFYDLGIFTKEGKIAHSHYDKYKQINRFVEMVNDVIKDGEEELHIIDFGCGKSYLTFVLYYFLTEVKKRKVKMIGLDLKQDVITHCNEIAQKYHYDDLTFELGDINGYQSEMPVDMVISLHACDVATDYAIYNAITWNAKYIFSVPCCQHEVNQQISDPQQVMDRYGLIKERYSSLVTDSIRGIILEAQGYDVAMLEFIDLAHSPKNILIRAIRTQEVNEELMALAKAHMDAHGYNQSLYRLIKGE